MRREKKKKGREIQRGRDTTREKNEGAIERQIQIGKKKSERVKKRNEKHRKRKLIGQEKGRKKAIYKELEG